MVNYKELPKMKTALPHKAGTLPSEIVGEITPQVHLIIV